MIQDRSVLKMKINWIATQRDNNKNLTQSSLGNVGHFLLYRERIFVFCSFIRSVMSFSPLVSRKTHVSRKRIHVVGDYVEYSS